MTGAPLWPAPPGRVGVVALAVTAESTSWNRRRGRLRVEGAKIEVEAGGMLAAWIAEFARRAGAAADNASHDFEEVADVRLAAAGGDPLPSASDLPDLDTLGNRPSCCFTAERTPDGLMAATGAALDAITEADARGFYAHCGFPLQPDPPAN